MKALRRQGLRAAGACVLLALAGMPAAVIAQDGQVFAVSGEWSASSRAGEPLESGGRFSAADSLVAPSSPLGGDRVILWFETGRISCDARAGGGIECSRAGENRCAEAPLGVISIAPCLRGAPSRVVRLMSVVMRAVGEDPTRYWPLLTRSAESGLKEDVVRLEGGGIRIPALDDLPSGRYRVCTRAVAPSGERRGTPRCGVIQLGATPPRVASPTARGLVEVEASSMWYKDSAWVLVVGDGDYPAAKAAVEEARRLVDSWTDVEEVERRSVLRAFLSYLATSGTTAAVAASRF